MAVNQLVLQGTVTGDPLLKQTPTGGAVADFRVACNHRRQINGEWVDTDTLFIGVSAWDRLGKHVVASVRKGDPVVVTGRLRLRQWSDPEGQPRSTYDVLAATVAPDLTRVVAPVQRHGPDPHAGVPGPDVSGPAHPRTGEVWQGTPLPEDDEPGDDDDGAPEGDLSPGVPDDAREVTGEPVDV